MKLDDELNPEKNDCVSCNAMDKCHLVNNGKCNYRSFAYVDSIIETMNYEGGRKSILERVLFVLSVFFDRDILYIFKTMTRLKSKAIDVILHVSKMVYKARWLVLIGWITFINILTIVILLG